MILDQIDALGALSHFDKNTIEQLKSRTNSLFDIIRTEKDSIKVAGSIEQLLNDGNSPDVDNSLFLLPKSIDEQVRIFSSSWYKFQVLYDPAKVLRQTRIPFLALHGDLDPYVLCDKNLRAIGDHLRQADNRQFALIKLKGVNHIMQDASTGSPADYTSNESSFSTRALELILSWLKVSLTFPD